MFPIKRDFCVVLHFDRHVCSFSALTDALNDAVKDLNVFLNWTLNLCLVLLVLIKGEAYDVGVITLRRRRG